jgi:hypothetical protein
MQSPTLYFYLELKDWVIVLATLCGPILAVQAQKAVEAFRDRSMRKGRVYEQLMATRAARLSPEHVSALNMIDLVFYGARTLGFLRRSAQEQVVLDAWKEYLDHLNTKAMDGQQSLWFAQSDELFTDLLFSIAQDLGYRFDRVQLKRGVYSPIAHSEIEADQTNLRKAMLSLFSGEHPLKMNVVSFPLDKEAVEANRAAIQNLGKALESGVLQVEVVAPKQS